MPCAGSFIGTERSTKSHETHERLVFLRVIEWIVSSMSKLRQHDYRILPSFLKLDPLLRADPGSEWMLYFRHLRYQVGGFNQRWWGVAAGYDDM